MISKLASLKSHYSRTTCFQYDKDGNIPLHMAAAAANLDMILKLGERFTSGASVRNEDGMLVSLYELLTDCFLWQRLTIFFLVV